MQKLAQQIQELAQKNSESGKELEKAGPAKKPAKTHEKHKREALKREGLAQQPVGDML